MTYSLLIYHTLQLAQYILNVANLRALDVVLLLEMFSLKSILIDSVYLSRSNRLTWAEMSSLEGVPNFCVNLGSGILLGIEAERDDLMFSSAWSPRMAEAKDLPDHTWFWLLFTSTFDQGILVFIMSDTSDADFNLKLFIALLLSFFLFFWYMSSSRSRPILCRRNLARHGRVYFRTIDVNNLSFLERVH